MPFRPSGCHIQNAASCKNLFSYPERELVDVDALAQYYAPVKPLSPTQSAVDDMLTVGDVQGRLYLNTALMPSITVQENNAAAALKIMSRFAADPHWLIYLPPTMSPCETSPLDNFLEHPLEAFAYYRSRGVQNVVCEKKHMGSRAVIVLCHTEETARKRFGVIDGSRGIIYTRTGRHFFDDTAIESEILERLDKVLTESSFWSDLATDWVCLDTELMPWSEKAQTLLSRQYAPVGCAGRDSIAAAIAALEETCKRPNRPFEVDATVSGQNIDPNELLKRFREKQNSINGYIDAYANAGIGLIDTVRICHAKGKLVNRLMRTGSVPMPSEENTWERMRAGGAKWQDREMHL